MHHSSMNVLAIISKHDNIQQLMYYVIKYILDLPWVVIKKIIVMLPRR